MTSRNGFYSLRKHARLLCKFVTEFTPVIAKLYPTNSTLLTALAAANAACAILVEEIDEQAEPGI